MKTKNRPQKGCADEAWCRRLARCRGRSFTPLRLSAAPAEEDLSIPGCESATLASGRPWDTLNKAIERAIDHRFVSM
jgi:hypothetical protein